MYIISGTNLGFFKEDHVGQHDMDHADRYPNAVEEEREGFVDKADVQQKRIQNAISPEQNNPCVASDQNTGPERYHDQQQENAGDSWPYGRDEQGHREAKNCCEDSGDQREFQRVRKGDKKDRVPQERKVMAEYSLWC